MWAERDRKRDEYEAELAQQREAIRLEHIKVVADALGRFWGMPTKQMMPEAVVAVDALIAHGVVLGVRIAGPRLGDQ